jgi:hypothetical protein
MPSVKKKTSSKKETKEQNAVLQSELTQLKRNQKKPTFAQLDQLIKLAKKTGNKKAVAKLQQVYRAKELN